VPISIEEEKKQFKFENYEIVDIEDLEYSSFFFLIFSYFIIRLQTKDAPLEIRLETALEETKQKELIEKKNLLISFHENNTTAAKNSTPENYQ
jgi:hypothetical protein